MAREDPFAFSTSYEAPQQEQLALVGLGVEDTLLPTPDLYASGCSRKSTPSYG